MCFIFSHLKLYKYRTVTKFHISVQIIVCFLSSVHYTWWLLVNHSSITETSRFYMYTSLMSLFRMHDHENSWVHSPVWGTYVTNPVLFSQYFTETQSGCWDRKSEGCTQSKQFSSTWTSSGHRQKHPVYIL